MRYVRLLVTQALGLTELSTPLLMDGSATQTLLYLIEVLLEQLETGHKFSFTSHPEQKNFPVDWFFSADAHTRGFLWMPGSHQPCFGRAVAAT